jgi:hypothetical protein
MKSQRESTINIGYNPLEEDVLFYFLHEKV